MCVGRGGGDRVGHCSLDYNPLARFPLLSIGLGLGVPFAREHCKQACHDPWSCHPREVRPTNLEPPTTARPRTMHSHPNQRFIHACHSRFTCVQCGERPPSIAAVTPTASDAACSTSLAVSRTTASAPRVRRCWQRRSRRTRPFRRSSTRCSPPDSYCQQPLMPRVLPRWQSL